MVKKRNVSPSVTRPLTRGILTAACELIATITASTRKRRSRWLHGSRLAANTIITQPAATTDHMYLLANCGFVSSIRENESWFNSSKVRRLAYMRLPPSDLLPAGTPVIKLWKEAG